jgi:transposase
MGCLKAWEWGGGHSLPMSKARLVITAVIVEGRSQGEAARAYGVSQGWVSRLVARYRAEGRRRSSPDRGARRLTHRDQRQHRRADRPAAQAAV